MNPERLRQIEQLYLATVEQPSGERDAFLAKACGDDTDLRQEVETLLSHSAQPTASLADEMAFGLADGSTVVTAGTRLGPYEIVGPLGKGGMARVYRAIDTRLDRPVAVKIAAARFGGHFEGEARTISALNHPHICTLYDVGSNYLVMELVEGDTLAARVRNGALSLDLTLRYGAQIAGALAAAHARGIVHRDLKPANIMITEAGIKVLDFGMAKFAERPDVRSEETQAGRGAVMGTPGYMAPEQLEGAECDARTDIFALGLVLYEMATGKKAFAGAEARPIAEALRSDPSPLDEVSPALARIVRRCVARKPEHRWQTAADLKGQLESAELHESEAGPEQSASPLLSRSGSRLFSRVAVPWISALVLVVAIGILVTLRKKPDDTLQMTPFTTYAGGQYEPAFSPDGTRLAFVWNNGKGDVFNLYAKLVSGGDPLRLTSSPSSEGSPAWSPDGSRVAFLRYAAPPDEAGIFVLPASGGSATRFASTFPLAHIYDRHLDWSPDGKYLAVVDKESAEKPFSIFLVSPETGERRKLTDPPSANTGDTGPAFAPDSKSLSFRRTVSSGVSDIFVVPIAGGEARRLTRDNKEVGGQAWTADGSEIVFASNRGHDAGLWRAPVRGGQPRAIPSMRVWANFLAIARTGQRLAFSHWFVDTNIWLMRLGSSDGAGEVTKLIASTREDRSPQFSPDGAQIAFRSDRSGWNEIWVCDSNGSHPVQLTNFRGPLTGSPHWSPDGRSIAFDSRPVGNADIFVVPAGGGSARRVTFDGADDVTPSWSNDSRWIYFASNRTGTYQVWKIAADADETKSQPVQVTHQGGFFAMERAPGNSLFYTKGPDVPGIWKVTPSGEEMAVLDTFPAGYWGYWCVRDNGLYFVTPSTPDGGVLQLFDLNTHRTRRLAQFEHSPLFSDSGLSVSRDGASILYTSADTSGSEITLVDNFR
jgi:Tol biopolymer transport system component